MFVMCRECGVRTHFFDEVCTRSEGRRPNVESLSRTFLLQDAVFQEQMFFTTHQEAEIRLPTMICNLAPVRLPALGNVGNLEGKYVHRENSEPRLSRRLVARPPVSREPLSKRSGPGSGSPVYLQILREHEEAPGLEVQATSVTASCSNGLLLHVEQNALQRRWPSTPALGLGLVRFLKSFNNGRSIQGILRTSHR